MKNDKESVPYVINKNISAAFGKSTNKEENNVEEDNDDDDDDDSLPDIDIEADPEQ